MQDFTLNNLASQLDGRVQEWHENNLSVYWNNWDDENAMQFEFNDCSVHVEFEANFIEETVRYNIYRIFHYNRSCHQAQLSESKIKELENILK